jgi:hypothetical protein
MATNDVIVALRAMGQVAFDNSMESSARSIGKVSHAADDAGTSVDRSGKQAAKSAKGWKAGASSLLSWAGSTAAVAGMGMYIKTATGAAVDLNEEISKTSVVFRGSEKPLLAWSKGTASALGIAQQEALSAAGTFGNMLVPMGIARGRAADMSQRMVTLASDMASFNNADPKDVLESLRSGLAGETEPLRKFGVFLSDARLRQEALSLGLKAGKGPLDAVTKAQATYSLILKDTKDAQGDFSRTSGSLANQQRVLKAQWTQLAATIGQQLLPVALKLASALSWLFKHNEVLIPVLGLLAGLFVAYSIATAAATIATLGFNAAFLLIPLAIAVVIAGLILAYNKVGWFRDAVNFAAGIVVGEFKRIVQGVKEIGRFLGQLPGWFSRAWANVKKTASEFASGMVEFGKSIVRAIINGIKSSPAAVKDALFSILPGGSKLAGALADVGVPGFAYGGVMGHSGYSIVGERGPELVQLPGGSRITPLSMPAPVTAGSMPAAGVGRAQTTAHFYLDRRLLGTAVAEDTADQKARR